jgi:hypothetical protein
MNAKTAGFSLVSIFLLLNLLMAQDSKPNLSGTWTLDREKSELGQRGGGRGEGGQGRGQGMFGNLVIEHSGAALTVKRKVNFQGEERTMEAKYTTDGKENVNEGFRGNQVKSKTYWEGAKLVTESKMETPNGTRETKEIRSLSADGKTMTVETTVKGGFGEGTRKLVYNKEG